MIKKFVSKGIIGLPDMEIELEGEKIVLIKGPNGSGKTSLLRQITHPFASHNRFHKLKPGVDEGHTIMYLVYKGFEYKIQHLYTKERDKIKVLSYISKLVNGSWVELSSNGLSTNFKDLVLKELDYQGYMYDILNIGIENRGIVQYTNTERIEYLKKILKMEVLNTIKENVLNNLKEKNSNLKYIKTKLEDFVPLKDAHKKIQECQNLSKTIMNEISDNNKKHSKLLADKDRLDEYMKEYEEYDVNRKDLEDIVENFKRIKFNPTKTYNEYIDDIKEEYSKVKAKYDLNENDLDSVLEEIASIKIEDESSLNKEKKSLEIKIKEIEDKYKNKRYDVDSNFNNVGDIEVFLKLIDEELSNDYRNNILTILKNPSIINDIRNKRANTIKELRDDIDLSTRTVDELSISYAFINIEYHEGDCLPTCPFHKEYERQHANLNLQNELKTKIEKNKKRLEDELEEQSVENYSIRKAEKILSMLKNKPNDFDKFFPNFIDDIFNNVNLIDTIVDYSFYYKDMQILENMNNRLEAVNLRIDISTGGAKKRREELIKKAKDLELLKDEYATVLKKIENEIKLSKIDFYNLNNATYTIKEVYKRLKEIKEKLLSLDIKIKELSYIKETIKRLEERGVLLNNKLQKNTEDYYELKNQIKESKKLSDDYNVIDLESRKLKSLKDIVSTVLPSKILMNYLSKVAMEANALLGEYMQIRFDTSKGVDIIINRDGTERLSSDLSQGEKSMLSMALLMIFKKNIPWDIISLDELDATLDESNRSRFIYMVRDYSNIVENLKQIFIVTHTEFNADGMDIKVIEL